MKKDELNEDTFELPEVDETLDSEILPDTESVEGTELDAFEAANIEDIQFVEDEALDSIIESILFASDRPVSLAAIKMVFKGTNVRTDKIKKALDRLASELAENSRGVSLEEAPGGYQLRTKIDNMKFISRTLKARSFRLSGPALEVMAIVAYKQPIIKSEIDQIRGVESGHLLRALMEKGLVTFGDKSELPGKPMTYETTKKFLEIFSLRNLKELPTLSQIDELLPEGITEEEEAKPTLATITESMAEQTVSTYSQGEEELTKITDELSVISVSSDFFEQEKQRQKEKREEEKAQGIREAILVGEVVSNRDRNWLARYDEAKMLGDKLPDIQEPQQTVIEQVAGEETVSFDEDDQLYSEESLEANDIADIDDEGNAEAEA